MVRSISSKPVVRFLSHLLGAAAACAVVGYAGDASAAWANCQVQDFYEIGPRSYNILCSNPSDPNVPTWIAYQAGASTSAENEARAARFQAMVLAALLSGHRLRTDLQSSTTGLCAGIADCSVIVNNKWGVIQ